MNINIKEKLNMKNFSKGIKIISSIILVGLSPIIALAATGPVVQSVSLGGVNTSPALGIGGLFDLSASFLNRAAALIIGIAVVWFIWNVFQYVIVGDEAKKADSKQGMVWGIVAIFVMVSVWGLVAILQQTFGTYGFNAGNTATDIKNMFPHF